MIMEELLKEPCKECDVGKEGGDWCPEGIVEPLDCPLSRKCNADSMGAGAMGLSMLIVYIVLIGVFWLLWHRFHLLCEGPLVPPAVTTSVATHL